MMAILLFIIILSFLVIIHEIGHFVVARLFKVRVEEFGLGYPPRAVTLFKKWGSLFSLNWIPFGGFVRMEGEDEEAAPTTTSLDIKTEGPFYAKPWWAKLAIILAGAAVNFLFGIVAFAIVFSSVGIPSGSIVDEVAPDSPAAQAGLQPNTAVVGVEVSGRRQSIDSWQDIVVVASNQAGQEITLVTQGPCQDGQCQSNQELFEVYVRQAAEVPEGEGAIGLAFSQDYLRFYPWYEMPFRGAWYGTEQALELGVIILRALQDMVVRLVTQGQVPGEVAGPVGIVDQAAQSGVLSAGLVPVLLFAGMLSVNLAVMNVLPIPALDGGRAVFIILGWIVGEKRIRHIEAKVNLGGYALLILLIVLVTARDVLRIVTR